MLHSNMATNRNDEGPAIDPAAHRADMDTQRPLPPLDHDKIAEMEALIGRQAVANMLNMMRTDIVNHVPAMIDDLIAGNMDQVRQAAHRLKGASSLLGVSRLADGMAQLEKIAIHGGDIQPIVNHLRQVATDTLRAIADRD